MFDQATIQRRARASDMGFEAVYALGYALFPKGTPEPHSKRNGEPDRDGGYAITHRWM